MRKVEMRKVMAANTGTIIQEVVMRTDRLMYLPGLGFTIALRKGENFIEWGKATYRPDEKRDK